MKSLVSVFPSTSWQQVWYTCFITETKQFACEVSKTYLLRASHPVNANSPNAAKAISPIAASLHLFVCFFTPPETPTEIKKA
jgi:hypothetical protein